MGEVSVIDGIGFGAAGLVLATFCMRSMSALRWVAIASNVAFIAYGYLGGLAPVLLLHMLLLPVNICRLAQLRSAQLRSDPSDARRNGGRGSAGPPFPSAWKLSSDIPRQAALPDRRVSSMR
jgi:hypothetical protein